MSTSRPHSGAVAIVGLGAILPDAPDVPTFWSNLREGRYSISDVTDRWDANLYWDPDPAAPDRTYSKIGGWCRDYEWNPLGWKMPIPPKVGELMDPAQKWAVACARQALLDYGYPDRPLDRTRTAVIMGNALGGDFHLLSAARILFPEVGEELRKAPSFKALPPDVQQAVMEEVVAGVRTRIPDITEDTMPGELGNIVAGRVAALFDFKGPNYIADAACASAMAAMSSAVEGLRQHDYDTVLTGGIDANMSASTFVKFAKIGALSASGTRPYAQGADGFVMGEGAAVFLLRRLEDAERDGDRIYAVLLGIGGSSDGKGKGITAPNPAGQKFAVERGWERAGVVPEAGDMVEGHGTSTKVGDVVEVDSLTEVFAGHDVAPGSVALGSVKSNIGHLKGAAGAAGVLKATLALHHKELPPSVNFGAPNPAIDFAHSPFAVNAEHREWTKPGANGDTVRRAGVSAFGFGGTNFHLVMEEYLPGRHRDPRLTVRGADLHAGGSGPHPGPASTAPRTPLRGALVIGGADEREIATRLREVKARADGGAAPPPAPPLESDLRAPVRLALDYGDAGDLAQLAGPVLQALDEGDDGRWRALRNKGAYLGRGRPGKVAFLFTGQGSQYVDMLKELRAVEPVVEETFREADRVMTPLLGGPLTDRIFVDSDDEAVREAAADALKQTEITQPAVLTVDTALCRLFGAYGIEPDLVMGHSLGEYGALVAAGGMTFADALHAVSARGEAMRELSMEDNGLMAAAFGSVEEVRRILEGVDGYAVVANINSTRECVIGGATAAMQAAVEALSGAGIRTSLLPVSHAFHTRIVEPAAEKLVEVLREMDLRAPRIPVVANVDASLYPTGPGAPEKMVEILGRQIGSAVQFVQGLETLYDAGARVFVEVGPKRALYGMADDVVGNREDVTVLFSNHPRTGDVVSANRALCGMYARGLGRGIPQVPARATAEPVQASTPHGEGPVQLVAGDVPDRDAAADGLPAAHVVGAPSEDRYVQLGRMFADFLERSFETWSGGGAPGPDPVRVGITGASVGLPGEGRIFDDHNVLRILRGDGFITSVPGELREGQLARRITRLVKGANGEARFEAIDDSDAVIKLAGRGGEFDLVEDFGFPEDRTAALDRVTRLAVAAGVEALRDAGIPLVMRYKSTSTGSQLPAGWGLPEEMRDDTGVVFGSAFPGYDSLVRMLDDYHRDRSRRDRLRELEDLRGTVDGEAAAALESRMAELDAEIEEHAFAFDRRFLFQVLSMGHSQFAEYIGARGPNTAVNGACATGMQALSVARDWIETGRCRRVLVITADDITTDAMFPWWSSGFLASGAAATDGRVEDAALPFDRRRHGLIIGMGGAGLVVEDVAVAAERGVWPICEVLGTVVANSAFHGSRLDMDHIAHVMESLVAQVERRWGLSRAELAREMVFVSHETYTPARGGSAGAEVRALRHVFGTDADRIVVSNTKGFTGHPMGVGIEESLAVKMLETGVVPPVANYRDVDPDLGTLNLSRGGEYPVRYALRLGAGFGSQIGMGLLRWTPPPHGVRVRPDDLGYAHRIADPDAWSRWLARVTGYPQPELETVHRTLRVRDQGPPAVRPSGRAATSMGVSPVKASPPMGAPTSVPPADPTRPRAHPTGVPAPGGMAAPAAVPARAEPAPVAGRAPAAVAASTAPARAPAALTPDAAAPQATTPRAPAAPATTPNTPTPQPTPPSPAHDPVAARVLEIVAEQTGYPPDMLELDLDLEADLGIDTVKQAEMFAAIRGAYDIERDENLALRDYPTLARAIDFVYEKRPDLDRGGTGAGATKGAPGPDGRAPDVAAAPSAVPRGSMEAAQEVPRRIPVPRLRPPLDRFPVTGIELSEGSRVLIVPDEGGVGSALAGLLEDRGVEVHVADPTGSIDTLAAEAAEWAVGGKLTGVYWLPALDLVPARALLDAPHRHEAIRRRVKGLHAVMRALYDDLGGSGTFFVSGVRLGGYHGYDEAGATDVLGGAVSGYTKAFARERPDALVKALDFPPSRKTTSLARLIVDETLRDPGAVEIGFGDDLRWSVGLEERPVEPGAPLDTGTVYVVTGAAGSIVSAILTDLARSAGGTYWLLDLADEPDAGNPDLTRVTTDPEGLKRDLFQRLQADGERVTPVQVEREFSRLEREASAVAAVKAIEESGGRVHFRSLDLRDTEAVTSVMREVVAAEGRVDVLIHAAGLEISRSIPGKSQEEFERVFDVKAEGWYNLLAGLGDAPVGSVVTFSSIAGRFGNAGQVDYAAANDLLCKAASALRRTHPETRAVSLDWTAWRDIGMAARGSIPSIMKAAGIDMLPPDAGIPVVRRELTAGTRGEVVVARALGVMLQELPERIALDGDFLASAISTAGPMVGSVQGFGLQGGLVVDTLLSPSEQPFLEDHRIDGTPVLPGVMGLEAMAEAARVPFPDRHVTAVEGVEFHAPFKFYRDEARTVRVQVTYQVDGEDVVADCRLLGARRLVGRDEPEVTVHFTGRVRLSSRAPDGQLQATVPDGATEGVEAPAIYDTYFHGPAYRVLSRAWRDDATVAGRFADAVPPNHSPEDRATLVAPRLVELAFQTAGLAEIAGAERMGLPHAFDRLEILRPANGESGTTALVRPAGEGVFDVQVADGSGAVVMALEGYRTSALPTPVDAGPFVALRE